VCVWYVTKTNAHVISIVDQIDRTICELQLNFNIRVQLHELGNGWGQELPAKAECCVHTQQALRHGLATGDPLLQFLQVTQDAFALLQVHLTLVRHGGTPSRPVQKPDTQAGLQLSKPAADRCCGDTQLLCGTRK